MRRLAGVLLPLLLGWSGIAAASTYGLRLVVSGVPSPVALANAGDGSNRLFVVDQGGFIRIVKDNQLLATPFIDLTSKVLTGGERGLLGLAFDPSYASNGFFYVFYTSKPSGDITIARYGVKTDDPDAADPDSELVLKSHAHPTFSNHNGGSLVFGSDGCLYAGIGDGGSGGDPNGNGQNLATLLGKIIRIRPSDGAPCAGNPFIGTAGARGEIWALGVRNPWRITFDRQTGDLFVADVGQGQREEVNFQPAGAGGRNYCWKAKEGTLTFDPNVDCTAGTPTDPVIEYDHSGGNCSITGGYRYRGGTFPGLVGTYFYADFCSGRIWGAVENGGTWTTAGSLDTALNISSFGEDEAGEIYVAHIGGAIYRLVAVFSHDFDGDGRSDIAWRHSGGAAAVWLMNAATVQQSGGFGVIPTNWQIVGQRDFNGGGNSDWLWRDGSSGTVAIWQLNGVQLLQSGSIGAVATSWGIVGSGDFNGDGSADILWRNSDTGTVAIWLLNGFQVLQSGSLGAVGSNWSIAGTGDTDGDGKADILWRDGATGTVAIWLLNGLQVRQTGTLGAVTGNWSIVGTGDFNSDGKADILWRDGATGTVAIWLLNGLQVAQSGGIGSVPANWTIAKTGDFNGDGKSDLLWRETGNGTIALWLLDGLQILQSSTAGTVALDWTIQGVNAD
jgi:glucose/arabinose dehydrogenase